jgi:phosphate transport system substrate-binding protein
MRVPLSRRAILLALASTGVIAGAADIGRRRLHQGGPRKELLIAGPSVMVALNEALAKAFSGLHPDVDIVVDKGGSLPALLALKRGAVDLAAMSRDLTVFEDDLRVRNFMIARNEISVLVNKALPLRSLTALQVKSLFSGAVTNWKQVGGPNAAVHVISRAEGSTARQFIEDVVLEGNDIVPTALEMQTHQQVAERVAGDPQAVGFISLNYQHDITAEIKYLEVDGVAPSRETVLSGRYPFMESFYLVCTRKPGPAQDFVAFALSPAGQKIVAQRFFLAVS